MSFSSNPLFKNIEKKLLSEIYDKIVLKKVAAKNVIFDEQFLLRNNFYILKTGIIILSRVNKQGNETSLIIKYPGDEIGLLNAVDGTQTHTRATSITESELFVFNEILTHKLLSNNHFVLNLLNNAIHQLRHHQDTIINFSSNVASKKILYQILKISVLDEEKKIRFLNNRISQNYIASFSSVSRETASREMNLLKTLGIIMIDKDKNILIDVLKAKKYLNE